MIKSKKLSSLLLILMLALSSILFVACGPADYSKTYLSASQTYIELFKDEEKNLTITIEKPVDEMTSTLRYSMSNPTVCGIEVASQQGMSTTYTLKAQNGGQTTIDFVSIDGGKSISVNVFVKEYSSVLQAGENGLYVSKSTALTPSSYDFVFEDSSTERSLSYYFYGKNDVEGSLTLEDVSNGQMLEKNFTKVELYSIEDKSYLIFTDEDGLYHTLGKSRLVAGSGNTTYNFITVSKTQTGYSFNASNATVVEPGEKFTFMTVYNNAVSGEEIYCERDFYVLIDIDQENVSHEFGYKINEIDYVKGSDRTSYKLEERKDGDITLIPNYVAPIRDNPILIGYNANYLTAYVEIAVKNLNEFLNVEISTLDKSVASATVLGSVQDGDNTIYCVELNCATGSKQSTSLQLNLYYKGFENSKDEKVNYIYNIPVNIYIKPVQLLANNIDLKTSNNVYKFYNTYASDSFGWQAFDFKVIPEGAEYDRLYIDLNNSDLQVKYLNVVWTTGILEISNISETVYIKGGKNAALTTENKKLPINLDFSVIQEDTIASSIEYSIVKGPSPLAYKTPAFENKIYIERFGGDVVFDDIYTDAEFSSMSFSHLSGSDVVNFKFDARNPYIKEGTLYKLNINITPTAYGNGTYSVTLDNGEQISINIEVGESLNSVSLSTKDENDVIRYMKTTPEEEETSSLIYVYNANQKTNFDLTLVANESNRSEAIDEILADIQSPYLSLTEAENKNSFIINVENIGTLSLIFTVQGFKIENFERVDTVIVCPVEIVSFNFLQRLNVYKISDGYGEYAPKTSASYANVYSNTYNENARKLKLEVSLQNPNAYLFANPANNEFIDSVYQKEYLYFESDSKIYMNEEDVNIMYFSSTQSNVYTIGNYGTFDTETLTFTAFSNLVNSGRLKLIAHVKQYGKTYSWTININIEIYEVVEGVSLQTSTSEIEFSALEREYSLIAYPTNKTATNGEIMAIFNGGQLVDSDNNKIYTILDKDSISYMVDDGKTYISLKVSQDFLIKAESWTDWNDGDLIIVAKDWLDNGGNIRSEYQELALHIRVTFANGDINHRWTIKDAEDLLLIKDNLSAHYQISTTIDASSISQYLPLGELKGSIVGVNEYAIITNINITTPYKYDETDAQNYYGLFTKIASNAYIEYVQFEGSFAIEYCEGQSIIGLVAAENNGKLINVGAKINASNVNIEYGDFGGLVGINKGEIIQDFTLFEEENQTSIRTYTKAQLTNLGRYYYANLTPRITVQMTGWTNVYYTANNTGNAIRIGGMVGYNKGLIQKIDSFVNSYNGYSNYMGYSLLKSQPSNLASITQLSSVWTGGLVGESNALEGGLIQGGYNQLNQQTSVPEFKVYSTYAYDSNSGFEAGEGVLVGGEVWAYGYVGGVVGEYKNLSSSLEFAGVTSRTFVRGQKAGDSTANLAIISNVRILNNDASLNNAFAIQAVDDGKLGEEASMALLYNNENIENYSSDVNRLGFGNFNNAIGSLKGYDGAVEETGKPINVFTYAISRELIKLKEQQNGEYYIEIYNSTKTAYYGDFIIVGTKEGDKVALAQVCFTKGNDINLSISPKFNNKMVSQTANARDVFYAYYFQVASLKNNQSIDISTVQASLDKTLNRISADSSIYPFVANGEMIFSSKTPTVLTIDQLGKITVKKTGLALISASSVLNTNNALNFYIYVVNYFNPESTLENIERNSIIYTDSSASSTPLDESIIELRGNNSAELFVRPRYDTHSNIEEEFGLFTDKFGNAIFEGISFNLAENTQVTAEVRYSSNDGQNEDCLEISVIGQNITIRKASAVKEGVYDIEITPVLYLSFEGHVDYTSQVNKILSSTDVNYKYGATNIANKNYNSVPIRSSKSIIDEVTVQSTDINEGEPQYYIVRLAGQYLQGTVEGYEYQLEESNYLFDVKFDRQVGDLVLKNGVYDHKFNLNIALRTNSTVYTDRYNKEIYGKYSIYIQPQSNSGLSICIIINFERTGVSSVIIDNYKSLDEIEGSSLTSTSEFAYPGEAGLLQITVAPEDSDFDYVLIENDDQNYLDGRATSTFSLLSRNIDSKGASGEQENGLFSSGKIVGSATSKGIILTQDEIIETYKSETFMPYSGIIYIKYNMSSKNVDDLSLSKINVKFFKDGEEIYSTFKNLTVKLKNFVAIEIENKDGQSNQNGYYMSYNVARGMKYRLNINSFGFVQNNIEIKSTNPSLGSITKENGIYYLTITDGAVDYSSNNEVFDLVVEGKQSEGENIRQASSKTKITVFEYVLNYNNELHGNEDIVDGVGEGVINVQVGSQIDLGIDLFNYIEYNASIPSVVSSIESFLQEMANKGNWFAFTNLISDDQPDYSAAPEHKLEEVTSEYISLSERKIYKLNTQEVKNYYFRNENLSIMPIRTHIPEERFYYFGYVGKFVENNGIYTWTDGNSGSTVQTTFTLNVYTTSSEESPIPIYDYEDLCNMQKGGYYILLNDITLPSIADDSTGTKAFAPLKGDFSSFDGNGHAINFAGTYDMGGATEIGLFKSLSEGSIIKNLIVNYASTEDGSDLNTNPNDTTYGLFGLRTVKFITSADSFVFGTIVAENAGIITNCQVYTEETSVSEYYLTVKADNALTGASYIGGVAGRNSGYITNCSVSINVQAPYNIGGVVAQNYNKVAGCYFKEGKLINNSQFSQYVGGFAISNSQDAVIMTCYVAGAQTSQSLFSKDANSYVKSTIAGAGFIYENLGKIHDCYTDIDLSQTTSEMAGFAYRNGGTIKNAFSLSILRNNTTASAGFVKEGIASGLQGEFIHCYYFYNKKVGENDKNINTSLNDKTFEGVEALTEAQFANFNEYFSDYSYSEGMSVNSVWFIAKGNTSSDFVEYVPTTQKVVIEGENGHLQTNTVYKTNIMEFGKTRLELVAPNIHALSIKNFAYSDVDSANGEVTYFYNDDTSTPNRGSIHNPRLIYNAQSMEEEILNETSTTNLNTTNYRLISDVNYNDFEGHSSLYKVKFAGVLEGNGMKISGISLVSMEELESAGLFAQIGFSQSKEGAVKNLNISARAVSFNNANSVGILAGTIKYGYVYDVTINSIQGSSATVLGHRFVGGVFGKAVSSFVIKDVYSSANASANFSPSRDDISYIENSGTENGDYSYAGSIAGFVGKGKLFNAHVNNVQSVMGGRVGFAYGGIGSGADVRYTFVDVATTSTLKPYQFAGYIAGEVSGSLSYAHVSDNNNIESTFSNVPKVAIAVGGIAGKFNGGLISNALMEQDFRCSATENKQTVQSVGGIVGLISANNSVVSCIENCVVNADISAGDTLGGGVGRIASATIIEGLAVKSNNLYVTGERANPCLGGVVGQITGKGSLEMINSYSSSRLEIKTHTAGIQSTAYAGGLIADAKVNPKLYYCWTTSSIYAEVYDSRQVQSMVDYKDIQSQDYAGQVTYEQKVDTNASNTYFWGSAEEAYNSSFVEFKTKAKSAPIKFVVSNFGSASQNISKSTFNNIYTKNYQITMTENSVADLVKTTSGYLLANQLFVKEVTSNTYFAEASLAENITIDDLIEESSGDIKVYYTFGNNKYSFVKETRVSDEGEPEQTKYYLQMIDGSSRLEWNGVDFAGKATLQNLKLRFEFDEQNLTQKTIYRGQDGNYYLVYLKSSNNAVDTVIENVKTGEVVTGITLEKVWADNVNSLPELLMEKNFTWLEMN